MRGSAGFLKDRDVAYVIAVPQCRHYASLFYRPADQLGALEEEIINQVGQVGNVDGTVASTSPSSKQGGAGPT